MLVYLLAMLFCFIGRFSYPWEMTMYFPRVLIALFACAETVFEVAVLIGTISNMFKKGSK